MLPGYQLSPADLHGARDDHASGVLLGAANDLQRGPNLSNVSVSDRFVSFELSVSINLERSDAERSGTTRATRDAAGGE